MGRLQHRRVTQRTFGSDPHQAIGNLADAVLQLGLFGLPRPPAQTVEQPLLMAIARQQFDVFDRKIKFGVFSIFQGDAGMRGSQRRDRLQTKIAPDPMFDMHHQIANGQRINLAQEVFRLAPLARLGHQPVAEHVLLRDDRQPRRSIPRLQCPDHQVQPATRLRYLAEVPDLFGLF